MKGLELSRAYFDAFYNDFIKDHKDLEDKIAIGLIGSGSDAYGFDDEISKDHDFEPGFQVFIPSSIFVSDKDEFILEREYRNLPSEFMGYKKQKVSPVGGRRHGVIRLNDFVYSKCGDSFGDLSNEKWLYADETLLYELVNGEIFIDNFKELTNIRDKLKYYPKEIMLKKLSGYLLSMAQTGEYNYLRLVERGELSASQLSLFKYVNASMHVVFIINECYMPYYKWSFKAFRNLKILNELEEDLDFLISENNNIENSHKKIEIIKTINDKIIKELINKKYINSNIDSLEYIAYKINDLIKDNNLRNMNILEGV